MKMFSLWILAFAFTAPQAFANCESSRALLVLSDVPAGLSSLGPLMRADTHTGTVDILVSPSGDPDEGSEEATLVVTVTVRLTGQDEPLVAIHRVSSGQVNGHTRTSAGDLAISGPLHNGASLNVSLDSCGGVQ